MEKSEQKKMNKPYTNIVPSPFLQAKFCNAIYDGAANAMEIFSQNGFELQEPYGLEVKELPFHMYIPTYFPASRDVVDNGYDWSRVPKELPIGFVARGTEIDILHNLKKDLDLLKEMIWSEGHPVDAAQENCSHIMRRLNGFMDEYPEIKDYGIQIKVYIAGHSLGGFLAAAITVCLKDWAQNTGSKVVCTTFESPGLTKYYWDIAEQQMSAEEWKDVITSYVALPNPMNMAHRHLGKIIFLNTVQVPLTATWVARCTFHTVTRVVLWRNAAANLVGILPKAPGMAIKGITPSLPAAATITQSSALATLLGMEIRDIVEQHKISNMIKCFVIKPPGLPLPEVIHEMKSWPSHRSVKASALHWAKQFGEFLVPFRSDNIGLHTVNDREGVIWRRLMKLEGFVPVEE